MTPSAAPVVVIGNGPVGQTAALLLARHEIPVVLLDGRAGREPVGSRSICQQRDVLDIWESVGVGAALAREGITWTTARTFFQDDELFSQRFQDRGSSPFPPFVNISQSRTEQALDERIRDQPLVDVRWSHRVTELTQDARGVTVVCQTPDGSETVTGAYAMVCAGGRAEALRAQLGVSFEGHTFGDQFLICDIRTELPDWEHERRFYFDPAWNPGRQVLIHPCPDSTFRIDWQVPADFDLAAEDADGSLDRRIRQVVGERNYDIVWKTVYRFQSRVVDRMRVGRVLIAGDAAHLMAPFGARGLNSGVQDAENAAWKLAYVLKGWAPEGLLESYHDERHAAALENLDVTAATMRFLVPQDDAQRQHRLATLKAARSDPAARAAVDSGRLAEPFWYVASPLTTPDARGGFHGRPPKGEVPAPAPGVLVPDLPVAVPHRPDLGRLRALARLGVTVLLGDDAAAEVKSLESALATATAPVAVHRMTALFPSLRDVLGALPTEAWILRPDGHIAAVIDRPTAMTVRSAVDRALGHPLDVSPRSRSDAGLVAPSGTAP